MPRLLVQLQLLEDAAGLILAQGVSGLSFVKVEDPQPVTEQGSDAPFLLRLPVRVRFTSSLPVAMKVLAALQQARPIIELQASRLSASSSPDTLDAELVLARYTVVAPAVSDEAEPAERKPSGKPAKSADRKRAAAKADHDD